MTELAALNVKINGDASDLRSALQSAEDGLENVENQAKRTNAQVATSSTGFSKFSGVLGKNSFAISNAANQFSDLAVQIQGGVSPARALSQQLPQMTAFMGPLASIIGVTAGVLIGLGGAFLSAQGDASDFQKTLDGLDDILTRVDKATGILEMSTFELAEKYGLAAQRVRELAIEELQLTEGRAASALQGTIDALDQLVVGYQGALRSGRDYRNSLARIEQDLGLTGSAAIAFAGALKDAANADDAESQIAAFQRMRDILELNGIEVAKLPAELQEALSKANSFEQAVIAVQAALERAAAAGAGLTASLPSTAFSGDLSDLYDSEGNVLLPPPPRPEAPSTGGAATVDPLAAELAALQESLMTQEELEIASYQRRLDQLKEFLAAGAIEADQYRQMEQALQAQHADAMAQIDAYRYGSTLDKTGAFLGDMASALAKGNDQMLQASKAFAAAEALVNAWRAYSQALADPTIPTLGKIAAAASVLSAGIGAVNAITSIGSSGTGATTAGASTAATTTAAAPSTSSAVAIQLTGGDMFSRDQVVRLINAINESVEDGAIVRLA